MKPGKGCFQDSTYDTKMFFEVTGAYDMVEDCKGAYGLASGGELISLYVTSLW